ncbi:MAG: hypothetical protein NC344_02260 [Bacteroidales bacterium]|nr:hypothetical protein [Bacteroidales bacterium]MCM1146656.1 hypothetical protein [Bacteroidales bacterium]MCM1511052.1 hypothetical protein [Clostridium sp.]
MDLKCLQLNGWNGIALSTEQKAAEFSISFRQLFIFCTSACLSCHRHMTGRLITFR